MHAFRKYVILGAVVLSCIALFLYFRQTTLGRYHGFHGREVSYYSQLARACESLLKQHPGLKQHSETSSVPIRMTSLDAEGMVWDHARLSPADPSLPEMIRTLRPDEVLLMPKRVFLGFGVGRGSWAIIWEESTSHTNTWTMYTNADGLVKEVYSESAR